MPGREEVRGFYPEQYYGEPGTKFQPLVERLVRLVGERHISFLTRFLAPGGRVLDVGCGRGVILGPLADRGFEVHGVEISAEAAQGADPRAEIRIASSLGDAGYEAGFFDQVVIWHVLEHVADPRGTLEEVARILRPGGRLIVAVPNFSSAQARWTGAAWFHLDLPRHLYHFPLAVGTPLLAASEPLRLDPERPQLLRSLTAQRPLHPAAPPLRLRRARLRRSHALLAVALARPGHAAGPAGHAARDTLSQRSHRPPGSPQALARTSHHTS